MSQSDEKLTALSFTASDVHKLKELFKADINSERRFQEISTIEELFNVLEDRDALTDDLLLMTEPKFRKFVEFQRIKAVPEEKLVIPRAVVRLICDNYPEEWEKFGLHLELSEEQITQCQNVEDVILKFTENCKGISLQEMVFRLNRAFEKCGTEQIKSRVLELMNS